MLDRVIEAVDDFDGIGVGVAGAAEGADRDDAGARGDAHQLSVRHNGPGHAGDVRIRCSGAATGVVTIGDCAREIGLLEINLEIDHRDDDLVAIGDAVCVGKMELVDNVLCRIARLRIGIVGIAGFLVAGVLILRKREGVNRLHRDIDVRGLDGTDHLTHRLSIGDSERVDRATQDADDLLRLNGEPEALRDAGDLLRGRTCAELHRHFVRRKPRFANGRHA